MVDILRKSQQLCEQVLNDCHDLDCDSCKHHGENPCPGVRARKLSLNIKAEMGEQLNVGDKIIFDGIKSEYILISKDGYSLIVNTDTGDIGASFDDYLTPTTLFNALEEHIAPIKSINGKKLSKYKYKYINPDDYIYCASPGDKNPNSYLYIEGVSITCPCDLLDENILDTSEYDIDCSDCYRCWMNNWEHVESYIKSQKGEK